MKDWPAHPLLADIEAFLIEARVTPTAFGRDAMGDPGFVFGLREGREPRRSTVDLARSQMAKFRSVSQFEARDKAAAD